VIDTPMPLLVADGAPAQALVLTCTPGAIGERTAVLTLQTNDPALPTVTFGLRCEGSAVKGDDEVSMPSATGSGPIVVVFTGGGSPCGFTGTTAFIGAPPGAPPLPPTVPPGNPSFPHGLFFFELADCTPGGTVEMTLTYPQPLPPGTVYWKYGPTPGEPIPHWYELPATIVGDTVVFSITDGGLGDDDLTVNGVIVDQGGPGVPLQPAVEIPSLGSWGLLVLAGLLAALALRRVGSVG
jgi:hypothetical protein